MTAGRPGNLANLQKATGARTAATTARAEAALDHMLRTGQPITFRGLAAAAPVSLDFLYRNPAIRQRIEQLRASSSLAPPSAGTSARTSPAMSSPRSPASSPSSSAATVRNSPNCGAPSKPRTARTCCYAAALVISRKKPARRHEWAGRHASGSLTPRQPACPAHIWADGEPAFRTPTSMNR